MSFVSSYLDSLAEGEDDELWSLFSRLYGPALELSCTFPSWRLSRRPLTFAVLLFYSLIMPVHFWLLSVSISCVRDDFNLVSMEFHYWLILMFSVISIFIMNGNRKHMISFHRSIIEGVGRYESEHVYKEEFPRQLEKNKQKQLVQFLPLPLLILSLAGLTLMIPYLKNMDGKVHYSNKGVNMKLPIAAWYPFPTHEGILSMVAIIGQFMTAGGMASVVASLDLLIFRMTQAIIFEFQVLQYALRTLIPRAKKLYVMKHHTANPEQLDTKDVKFQKCIEKCIKECVVHHHNIMKMLKQFTHILTWLGFLGYGFGTGVIGLSLINILKAKDAGNYENTVLFMGLAFGEVLNMFMLSSFCESISTESKELRQQLYFIDWHILNTSNRKLLINFQMGLNNAVVIKFGGIIHANLDTFSSIMNTSYSFFNLVNAQDS